VLKAGLYIYMKYKNVTDSRGLKPLN
jgi:hypothetical protein